MHAYCGTFMYDRSSRYPFTHFDGLKHSKGMMQSSNCSIRRPANKAAPAGKACGMPTIFGSAPVVLCCCDAMIASLLFYSAKKKDCLAHEKMTGVVL